MNYTIGACGFSGTGSSMVSDYLSGFDENCVLDKLEFDITYLPDGLQDLRYFLHEGGMRDYSCRTALVRYKKLCHGLEQRGYQNYTNGKFLELTDRYLESLIQLRFSSLCRNLYPAKSFTYKVFRRYHFFYLYYYIEKMTGHEFNFFPFQRIGVSIYPEDFEKKTKDYVRSILDAMGRIEGKNLVLDQPFSGNNPAAAFSFFDNPKAIVVDRDPRDIYVLMKDFWRKNGFRGMPADNPKDYCLFHRKLRENMPYMRPDPNILIVRFEDMIYRYEETSKKINAFCELEDAKVKRRVFKPEKSIANTQVYKRYPQLTDDIKYIKNELSEYLYPFEDFKDMDTSGKMFDKVE